MTQHGSVRFELTFLGVNLDRCDSSSDTLLWWCGAVGYKAIYPALNLQVFHSLYFGSQPPCWSPSSTATDNTSLITLASDSFSLFGSVTISKGQLFSSWKHLGINPQSVDIFSGLHPLHATCHWNILPMDVTLLLCLFQPVAHKVFEVVFTSNPM